MKGHTDLMHRLGEAQRPAVPRHGQGPALLVRAAWSPAASTFAFVASRLRTTSSIPRSSGLLHTVPGAHQRALCERTALHRARRREGQYGRDCRV
jgi:hypothetical protein